MTNVFSRLSLVLAVVMLVGCGSSNITDQQNHQISKLPKNAWKIVNVTDLPKEDMDLWTKYHAGHASGVASIDNECFKRNVEFKAEIRKVRDGLEERIIYNDNNVEKYVFGPQVVVSPFVIWVAHPGTTKDIDLGKLYDVKGKSLIFEKMEAVAYQYICYKGKLITILTAN